MLSLSCANTLANHASRGTMSNSYTGEKLSLILDYGPSGVCVLHTDKDFIFSLTHWSDLCDSGGWPGPSCASLLGLCNARAF